MAKTTQQFKLDPDILKDVKSAQLTVLEPTKVHLLLLDANAPDEYVQHLGSQLSAAGIFAIILTTPNVKVFSTFPVAIEPVSRIDLKGTAHDPKKLLKNGSKQKLLSAPKKSASKSTTKKRKPHQVDGFLI